MTKFWHAIGSIEKNIAKQNFLVEEMGNCLATLFPTVIATLDY